MKKSIIAVILWIAGIILIFLHFYNTSYTLTYLSNGNTGNGAPIEHAQFFTDWNRLGLYGIGYSIALIAIFFVMWIRRPPMRKEKIDFHTTTTQILNPRTEVIKKTIARAMKEYEDTLKRIE